MSERIPTVAADSVPWLSVDQMREVDRIVVDELGISLVRMMENAGRSLAQLARHLLGGDARGSAVLVLAGSGGNGGGGLVAARHLAGAGAHVTVALADRRRLAAVPAEQLAILRRLGVPIRDRPAAAVGEPELVIDALLGYGQQGDPRGGAAMLIRGSSGRRVLALDVPSGLEPDTGVLRTPHLAAEATLTLAAPKLGLAQPAAAGAAGRLFLADISVPALAYERLGLRYETPFGAGSLVEITAAGIRG